MTKNIQIQFEQETKWAKCLTPESPDWENTIESDLASVTAGEEFSELDCQPISC